MSYKRITLHPLKEDGTMDLNTNLYPKTLDTAIVNSEGESVEIATKADLTEIEEDLNTKLPIFKATRDTLISELPESGYMIFEDISASAMNYSGNFYKIPGLNNRIGLVLTTRKGSYYLFGTIKNYTLDYYFNNASFSEYVTEGMLDSYVTEEELENYYTKPETIRKVSVAKEQNRINIDTSRQAPTSQTFSPNLYKNYEDGEYIQTYQEFVDYINGRDFANADFNSRESSLSLSDSYLITENNYVVAWDDLGEIFAGGEIVYIRGSDCSSKRIANLQNGSFDVIGEVTLDTNQTIRGNKVFKDLEVDFFSNFTLGTGTDLKIYGSEGKYTILKSTYREGLASALENIDWFKDNPTFTDGLGIGTGKINGDGDPFSASEDGLVFYYDGGDIKYNLDSYIYNEDEGESTKLNVLSICNEYTHPFIGINLPVLPTDADVNLGSEDSPWGSIFCSEMLKGWILSCELINPNDDLHGLTLPDTSGFTANKEIATTDQTFNVINASDIVNNTLTQAQYDLITNGKLTAIKGLLLNVNSPILYPTSIEGGTAYGILIAGTRYPTIVPYSINVNSRLISLLANTRTINLNGINSLNGKSIPANPSNTGTFTLKCVDGVLTWVEDV